MLEYPLSMDRRFSNTTSEAALSDQDLAAQIASIIKDNHNAIHSGAGYIYASVTDGIVTLYGVVRGQTAARDIEAAVRKQIRCAPIRNNIQTTGIFPEW